MARSSSLKPSYKDVQYNHISPQDRSTNNLVVLDHSSNYSLLQGEQFYNSSTHALAEEGADCINLEGSIDWLTSQAYDYYDYKNATSTSILSPPHSTSYGFNYQSPLIHHNLINKTPLGSEPTPLDLHLFEQELEIYDDTNIAGRVSTQLMIPEMDGLKRLFSDSAPSSIKHNCMADAIISAPTMCRSSCINGDHFGLRMVGAGDILSCGERGDEIVKKREEVEREDEIKKAMGMHRCIKATCSSTPREMVEVRRETQRRSCSEEDPPSLCREEGETMYGVKRKGNYCSDDEREKYREETSSYKGRRRRYEKICLDGKRENAQGRRKRAKEAFCAGVQDDEVIHVRARRGQATDSHSLAERMRRERISQRMKLLQDLVPSCTKVLGKAAVLEEIINYVKSLQQHIEFLSMRLAASNYNKKQFPI